MWMKKRTLYYKEAKTNEKRILCKFTFVVCGGLGPAPQTMQVVREYIYAFSSKTNLAIVKAVYAIGGQVDVKR